MPAVAPGILCGSARELSFANGCSKSRELYTIRSEKVPEGW